MDEQVHFEHWLAAHNELRNSFLITSSIVHINALFVLKRVFNGLFNELPTQHFSYVFHFTIIITILVNRLLLHINFDHDKIYKVYSPKLSNQIQRSKLSFSQFLELLLLFRINYYIWLLLFFSSFEFSMIFTYFASIISVSFSSFRPSSKDEKLPIIILFKLGVVSFWYLISLEFLNLNSSNFSLYSYFFYYGTFLFM